MIEKKTIRKIILLIIIIISLLILISVFVKKTSFKKMVSCDNLKGLQKDICLSEQARKTNDYSYCNRIKDENIFYACKDRYWERSDCSYFMLLGLDESDCWNEKMLNAENISSCIDIINESFRNNCINRIIMKAVEQNKSELCGGDRQCIEEIEINNLYKSKDINQCLKFKYSNYSNYCYIVLLTITNNKEICNNLKENEEIVKCKKLADFYENQYLYSSACKNISFINSPPEPPFENFSNLRRQLCDIEEILKTGNKENCKNKERSDICYLLFAVKNKDATFCYNIKNETYKAICNSAYKRDIKNCNGLTSDINVYCRALAIFSNFECNKIEDMQLSFECESLMRFRDNI
ncbi:MAG: hypothetical protein QXG86_03505 [Candidatus Woesearchaeota archaeon]